jgi:FkbM family methyltransferase
MKSIMKKYQQKFENFKYVVGKDNPIIIEIGSHYGEDSLRFIETFEKANVYCFEPDPRNIDIHKKHINDDRIKLFEIALSNQTGEAEFYQSYDDKEIPDRVFDKYDWIDREEYIKKNLNNSGSSSLKKGYGNVLEDKIKVKTKRFDEWYDENLSEQLVDFCWIDVQGAEKDVFNGMGDKINKIKHIWVEYGEMNYEDAMDRNETIRYLESKGFFLITSLSSYTSAGDLLFVNKGMN